MTTQATEPEPPRPQWTNTYALAGGNNYLAGRTITFSVDSWMPVDTAAREIELPRGSTVFEHFLQVALSGGVLYLTRHGRRVAAIVPADVAESFEAAEPDREPGAGLREILEDAEARVGPVPPEIAAEVDRQWDAALAGM
jgi:hypothetical protein